MTQKCSNGQSYPQWVVLCIFSPDGRENLAYESLQRIAWINIPTHNHQDSVT
jgi:hypothetical protein